MQKQLEISKLDDRNDEPANLLFLGGRARPNPQRVPMDQANSDLPHVTARTQFLEGLNSAGPYRYGDTSVSPGSTKSGGFSCPNSHAINIVIAGLFVVGGSRVSGFEALRHHCWPQDEYQR
jgi:hypothetical protein